MTTQLVERPAVAELTFQAFDKAVHPELIDSIARKQFQREGYRLTLHLTPAGHVFEWRLGEHTIVEVLADQGSELPHHRQIFGHRIGHERAEKFKPCGEIEYQVCFQIEKADPAVFRSLCEELRLQAERDGVLQLLHAKDRLGICPMSFVDLQARPGSLLIHAFHTFPDEYAVVKSQSLIDFGTTT